MTLIDYEHHTVNHKVTTKVFDLIILAQTQQQQNVGNIRGNGRRGGRRGGRGSQRGGFGRGGINQRAQPENISQRNQSAQPGLNLLITFKYNIKK